MACLYSVEKDGWTLVDEFGKSNFSGSCCILSVSWVKKRSFFVRLSTWVHFSLTLRLSVHFSLKNLVLFFTFIVAHAPLPPSPPTHTLLSGLLWLLGVDRTGHHPHLLYEEFCSRIISFKQHVQSNMYGRINLRCKRPYMYVVKVRGRGAFPNPPSPSK